MTARLGNPHKSALLALMALAREVPNPELQEIAGFTITGEVRTTLNDDGLVDSRKVGRAFVHELTEKGWAHCAKELTADPPARPGPFGNALYLVLTGLDRYLRRNKLRLADVFQIESPDLEFDIRTAYHKRALKPRDWVRLAEVRPLLNGATKSEVDDVLREMSRAGRAHLAPDSNRKGLTEADHLAAIRVGSEDKHLLAIEES